MLDIRSSSETAGIGRHRTERRDNDKYEFHSPLPIQKAIAARSLADELGAHTDEHREASCRQIRFMGTSMLASPSFGAATLGLPRFRTISRRGEMASRPVLPRSTAP